MADTHGGRHRGGSQSTRRRGAIGAASIVTVVVAGIVAVNTGNFSGTRGSASKGGTGSTGGTVSTGRVTSARPATTAVAATLEGATSTAGGAPGTTATPTLQVPVDARTTAPSAGTPVELIVDKIGVDTSLYPLHLLADGSLQSPPKWQQAGWFAAGVRPGDIGPAVIAGHIDSYRGPAVFYRLTKLGVGDHVVVVTSAGSRLSFTVSGTQEFHKAAFPTDKVYGPTPLAELKLVTCTGNFDRARRSYVDNLIVTAVLDSPSSP